MMSVANTEVNLAESRNFAGCRCRTAPKQGRTPIFGFVIERDLGTRQQTNSRARVFRACKAAGDGRREVCSDEAIGDHGGSGCHAFKAIVTHEEVPPAPRPHNDDKRSAFHLEESLFPKSRADLAMSSRLS